MQDAQSLRVFADPVTGEALVAVATPGAVVHVLQPGVTVPGSPNSDGNLLASSADHGNGGAALAVADNSNHVDVYLGVLTYFANNAYHSGQSSNSADDDMVGALVHLTWNGTSLSTDPVRILDSGAERAYGVCGIAVGDAIPGTGADEIVVGTLDGKLLVFERLTSGQIGQLLYSTSLEGAVGAYNSIVIADLDASSTDNEVYVAGSFGLRKFVPNIISMSMSSGR